jgi:outer membrane protein assembly factor BamB
MRKSIHQEAWLLCMAACVATAAVSPAGDGDLNRVNILGESEGMGRRLAELDKLIAQGDWAEVVSEYQRELEGGGDDLIPLGRGHSISARRLCHIGLALLPPPALDLYRQRVDHRAEKWWRLAVDSHDAQFLWRIVDETFCSRYSDRALDMLGDMAFERGDLEEAAHWWRMISPFPVEKEPARGRQLRLVFPDPKVDVPRVHAKQLLAAFMRGEVRRFEEGMTAYRRLHARSAGDLAGVNGKYAETLHTLTAGPHLLACPVKHPGWSTFAGDASRAFLVPELPHPLSLAKLAWWTPLPSDDDPQTRIEASEVSTPSAAANKMAFYPVIHAGQVLIAGPGRVIAYEAASGKETGRYELMGDIAEASTASGGTASQVADRSFTLTVAGECAYARLGASAMQPPEGREGGCGESYLICLFLSREKDGRLRPRWRIRAQDGRQQPAMFEGSPLVRGGRAYVAVALFSGVRLATTLHCYDAATGVNYWRVPICEASEMKVGKPRCRQYLLTAALGNIVYCSHSGAVVAVDATSGRRSWAIRYPSRGMTRTSGTSSVRDVAPCLYANGRIFAAPADSDRILCLDAETGQELWESQPVEVVHLLGVAYGRLIFTTGSWPRGVHAIDCDTGRMVRQCMFPGDGQSELPSLGRGVLADGKLCCPTLFGIRVLGLEDLQPDTIDDYYVQSVLGRSAGNLAMGEGYLALADAERLHVFRIGLSP